MRSSDLTVLDQHWENSIAEAGKEQNQRALVHKASSMEGWVGVCPPCGLHGGSEARVWMMMEVVGGLGQQSPSRLSP